MERTDDSAGPDVAANLLWRKSSASGLGDCVEVALNPTGEILVRTSKSPDGPVLRFTHSEWEAFVKGVRLQEFDFPAVEWD